MPNPRVQLEVRDLQLLLALSEAGSTAAAAQQLHLTQSAISRALTQAEGRLGARLFERGSRGVVPTAAGARLIGGAARLLSELSELERAVSAPPAAAQRVRLVCECYTAYRWLPSAVAELRERMPDLELSIRTEHTREPVRGLLQGEIDIALLTTGQLPKGQARFAEQALFSDEIVFAVSREHRLAHSKTLTRDDLRSERIISGHTPPAERAWFMRSVFGRGKPKLRFLPLPLTEAIVDAARAAMGIAVLSEWMLSAYTADGTLLVKRLSSGPLRRPWRIAYQRESADVAQRLLGALSGYAPRLSRR